MFRPTDVPPASAAPLLAASMMPPPPAGNHPESIFNEKGGEGFGFFVLRIVGLGSGRIRKY
jgi:hypothetical protein